MGLKRHDELNPASVPALGKTETSYPSPNKADRLVIERVPIAPSDYAPLPYHSPHPQYDTNGLILVWQGKVRAENNQIAVVRVYSTDLGNDDWHNFAIKYSGDVVSTPVYVRSYVELREDYSALPKATPLQTLMRLRVSSEGAGYTYGTPPTVTLTGGGASTQATARAIMNPAGTKVIGLELLTAGVGYTGNPAVGFSGGTGSGVNATAEIQPVGAVLVREETAKLDSEDSKMASLFVRVTRIYETLPGPWIPFTRYDDDLGPIQGRRRAVQNTGQLGGVITPTGKRNYEGRDGSAIVSIELEENWSDGTGTPGNPLYPILVTDFYEDERGAVEQRSQIVVATGSEVGSLTVASGVATLIRYEAYNDNPFLVRKITEVWAVPGPILRLTDKYDEFLGKISGTRQLVENTSQAQLESATGRTRYESSKWGNALSWKIIEVWVPANFPQVLSDTYTDERGAVDRTTQLVVPVGTEAADFTRNSGVVTKTWYEAYSEFILKRVIEHWVEVVVTDKRVTSEFGGAILAHNETTDEPDAQSVETGYLVTDSRLVKKSPHEQTLITEKFDPSSAVPVIELLQGGTGYGPTAPTVGFAGGTCGTAPTASAVLGFPIASVTVNNGGTGFNAPPAVGFRNGGGGGANAIAVLGFGVASVAILAGGSYTVAPTVAFSGDGTGATGNVVLGFPVYFASIISPGGQASGTLTSNNTNVANNDTVTIGTKVYTFKTALTPTEGEVQIGASADASLLNLIRAINHTGTPGTDYSCAAEHPLVTAAVVVTAHAFAVTAKQPGAARNTLATTETSANLSWGGPTLVGGFAYTEVPRALFTGDGVGAGGDVIMGYPVGSIEITDTGGGFTSPPEVISNGGGSGLDAIAVLGYELDSIDVTDPGNGDYPTAPDVVITPPGGAEAHSILSRRLDSIVVGVGGTGFTSPPTVDIDPPTGVDGVQATAHAVLTGGTAPIQPDDIAGLELWLKAEELNVALDDNDPVASWADLSGTGNDATQASGTKQPVFKTAQVNGKGVVRFDGVDDILALTNELPDTATVLVVMAKKGALPAQAPIILDSGVAGGGIILWGRINTGTNWGGFNTGFADTSSGEDLVTDQFDILELTTSVGTLTSELYRNGTLKASSGQSYGGPGPFSSIGGQADDSVFAQIDIAEIIVFNSVLSGPDREGIEAYLADEYGIVIGGGGGGDEVGSIVIDDPGYGYLVTPVAALSGGGGTGATATVVLETNGFVDSVVVDVPGLFETPPAITFDGAGTDAAADATLGTDGQLLRVDVINGGIWETVPLITLIGGGGTGATATAVLDFEQMHVHRLFVNASGRAYTTAPAITFSYEDGVVPGGLTAIAVLNTVGEIIGVTMTASGGGYTTATPVFSGGTGSGGLAMAILATTGVVKSVTIQNGGLFKTVPTVSFIGGGGTGAVGAAVLASTGSVVELLLLTLGSCTAAPTVTFTGSNTTVATALYHIGSDVWPANPGFDTDQTYGIVVDKIQQVVPTGTPHGGRAALCLGRYIDQAVIDRWKSVRKKYSVDVSTLPCPETFPLRARLRIPPRLLSIEIVWTGNVSKLVAALAGSSQVRVSSGANGAVIIRSSKGFNDEVTGYGIREWFFGPPPLAYALSFPIFNPRGSSGSVAVSSTNSSTGSTQAGAGVSFNDSFQSQVHELDIRDHLVGFFNVISSEVVNGQIVQRSNQLAIGGSDVVVHHTSQPQSGIAIGPGGVVAIAAAGTPSTMKVSIPQSSPLTLPAGVPLLVDIITERWKLDVWQITRVYVPTPAL